MAIAIIGTVGVPACYGGFETLVENLLNEENSKFSVYCSSRSYLLKPKSYKGAKLYYVALKANGIQSVLYDVTCFISALLKGYKELLMLGVSGAIILPLVRFFGSKAWVVTNIDGLEWKRDKWGRCARWFLKFSEKLAVKYSNEIVADNQSIADYVLKEYGVRSVVIAYGGDHAVTQNVTNDHDHAQSYALGLCRIEPENNVQVILDAFSKTCNKLVFIGNWDSSRYGRSLKEKYSIYPNLDLRDSEYNAVKLFKVRNKCCLYIHGHSAGGTNPSLVEMMHFAKPIVAFDCSYNRASLENKGRYFNSVDSLIKCISEKADDSEGNELFEIAKRRYTWKVVRSQYLALFS